MEETLSFFTCYRMLIDSYRLTPETEEVQLAEILRRVRDVNAAAPPPAGRYGAAPIRAGGTSV